MSSYMPADEACATYPTYEEVQEVSKAPRYSAYC